MLLSVPSLFKKKVTFPALKHFTTSPVFALIKVILYMPFDILVISPNIISCVPSFNIPGS